MANFNVEQQKIIYNAVRYYQINRVALDSKTYKDCDAILNELFPTVIGPVPVNQQSTPTPTDADSTV